MAFVVELWFVKTANSQTTKTHDRHFSTFSMPSAASGGHYSNSKFGIRTLPLTEKWRLKFLARPLAATNWFPHHPGIWGSIGDDVS